MGRRPVDKRLARCLDRYVGFSQSSIMSLRERDIHMDEAFKNGVPYLSQSETAQLGSKFLQPSEKTDPTDRLTMSDYDKEAIDFYNYAAAIIHTWYTSEPRPVRIWGHCLSMQSQSTNRLEAAVLQYYEPAGW